MLYFESPNYHIYTNLAMGCPIEDSTTTTPLTPQAPAKAVSQPLQRRESQGIPIPGRPQYQDDMPGSPQSTSSLDRYSTGPAKFAGSPGSPVNNRLGVGCGYTGVVNRAIYRARSPLSSSVPTGGAVDTRLAQKFVHFVQINCILVFELLLLLLCFERHLIVS